MRAGGTVWGGADDLPLISYSAAGATNFNTDSKVAHCDDALCAEATIHAIDSDGLGLISYYDLTNKDLKVAHCGFVIC